MSTQEDAVISLGTRQIDVQRRNLVQMCRLTVKSLIDKSSFEPVDDNSNELINFFAVMEQLLLHRIRPQKKWYGTAEPAHYWDYMRVACRKVSNNCITNIESIENIKTSRGKGRAWLRVALMEKRLAEYFSNALSLSRITKKFYLEGSVMLSEDTGMLCGTLLGLNSIDFSFCLKGDNLELMGPLAIDYSPYLLFQHSGDDLSADGDNQPKLDNANLSSSIMSESDLSDASWVDRFKRLEVKFKNVSEQKGYLEELVRLRQSQLDEATRQRQKLLGTLEHYESESRRERQQLEGVIIELQGQLVAVKEQLKVLQRELASLRARVLPQPNSSSDGDLTALAMREMSGETTLRLPRQIISSLDSDVQSQGSDVSSQLVGGETRSVLTQSASKQETQSLVPLAGSFSSEASFKSGDLQLSAMSKASGESITESQTSKKSMDNAALVASQISPAEDGVVSKEPLLAQNNEIRESAEVTVTRPTIEGNGNQVEQLPSVSVVDDPEVRSSPDGEVSEDRTILAAIVGGPEVTAPDGQEEGKSSDDSSDDGKSPPREMTVEETSSDNSNGEWTLLPRTEDQQDPASSSSEGLGAPEEVTAGDNSSEQPIEHSDIKEESTQDM